MKMWLVDYTNKRGVVELEGQVRGKWFSGGQWGPTHEINKHVFEKREDALATAEIRRVDRIASLRKQIAKLEGFSFGPDTA